MRKGLLVIPGLVFMAGALALGQGVAVPGGKPSDCLKEEKSIRPPATAQNAALEYFRVWDSISASDLNELSNVTYARIIQDQPSRLEPAKVELLLKRQDYIEGLMRCAAMESCDWCVQHEYGEDFRLPHLRLLRNSYRALKMDFDRCIEDRSGVAAAARVVAVTRLSNQTRSDKTWISALVGSAINQGARNGAEDFLKSGLATPATAKQILDAFRAIQRDDLFGYVSAIDGERWQRTQWPKTVCTGEHAGEIYLEKTGGLSWYPPFLPRMFLIGKNELELRTDLDRCDQYFGKVLPMWLKPENDLRLRELEVEAAEGQFGLVASLEGPFLEQMRRGMARTRREMEKVEADLSRYVGKVK